MTLQLRRSELAVPASKPRMIEKAAASDADLPRPVVMQSSGGVADAAEATSENARRLFRL